MLFLFAVNVSTDTDSDNFDLQRRLPVPFACPSYIKKVCNFLYYGITVLLYVECMMRIEFDTPPLSRDQCTSSIRFLSIVIPSFNQIDQNSSMVYAQIGRNLSQDVA